MSTLVGLGFGHDPQILVLVLRLLGLLHVLLVIDPVIVLAFVHVLFLPLLSSLYIPCPPLLVFNKAVFNKAVPPYERLRFVFFAFGYRVLVHY
jgi:hypothetical protein